MNTQDLSEIITLSKEYIKSKLGFTDAYLKLFSENKKSITLNNYRFLYTILEKNINLSNEIIIKLYLDKFNTIIKEVIVDSNVTTIEHEDHNYQFLKLLNSLYLFYFIPKKTLLLWNDNYIINDLSKLEYKNVLLTDNELISAISSPLISTSKVKTKKKKTELIIFKTNYVELSKYTHDVNYRLFNNLNRIVSINTGNQPLLNYYLILNIDNDSKLYFNVYDKVKTNKVTIKNKEYSLKSINKIIDTFKNDLLKIPNIKCYLNLLTAIPELRYLIPKIFNNKPSLNLFQTSNKQIFIPRVESISLPSVYCEHEKVLDDLKIISSDYSIKYNTFIRDYIVYVNDTPVCSICGTYIPLFMIQESFYIKKQGELLITLVRENIFNFYPYSQFKDGKLTIQLIINTFDTLYNIITDFSLNNISRLVIDWMLELNNKRMINEEKYSEVIKKSDLFFLRMDINVFNIDFNIKEKYSEKKLINLYIIVLLVLLENMSFNTFIYFINRFNNKNMDKIFELIIKNVFSRSLKIKVENLEEIIKVYIELFNDELKLFHQTLTNVWNENIYIINLEKKNIYITDEYFDLNVSLPKIFNIKPLILRPFSVPFKKDSLVISSNNKVIQLTNLKDFNFSKDIEFEYYHLNTKMNDYKINSEQNLIEYKGNWYPNLVEYPFSIKQNKYAKIFLNVINVFVDKHTKIKLDYNWLLDLNAFFSTYYDGSIEYNFKIKEVSIEDYYKLIYSLLLKIDPTLKIFF